MQAYFGQCVCLHTVSFLILPLANNTVDSGGISFNHIRQSAHAYDTLFEKHVLSGLNQIYY
jgi:hypothetical protein